MPDMKIFHTMCLQAVSGTLIMRDSLASFEKLWKQ